MECKHQQQLAEEYFRTFKEQQRINQELALLQKAPSDLVALAERQAGGGMQECYEAWCALLTNTTVRMGASKPIRGAINPVAMATIQLPGCSLPGRPSGTRPSGSMDTCRLRDPKMASSRSGINRQRSCRSSGWPSFTGRAPTFAEKRVAGE